MSIKWKQSGLNEKAIWKGNEIIRIDKRYYRPSEVDSLLGDASKAKKELEWVPKYNFNSLINEMIESDLKLANNELLISKGK